MARMVPWLNQIDPAYQFLSAAKGATSITQWQRGCELFDNLIGMTRHSMEVGRTIQAMFVSQGEADTYELARAQGWRLNFLKFVASFRRETGLKGLHVVYAQLGAPWGSPYVETVKRAQAEMQANKTLHMVTLDDLPYADPPHYADYEIVARRFMGIFRKFGKFPT